MRVLYEIHDTEMQLEFAGIAIQLLLHRFLQHDPAVGVVAVRNGVPIAKAIIIRLEDKGK